MKLRLLLLSCVLASLTACDSNQTTLVVYTALDRQFSEPVFEAFQKKTGITVLPAYDTEAQKTVGLTNRIRTEKNRPRCDVFWNNEILNTLLLKNEGLLVPCKPSQADNIPEQYRDAEGYWFGLAARARVLIVNTDIVAADKRPSRVEDLAAPEWKGQTAIAKPLFGTTASHAACLFAKLGSEKALALFQQIKANDVQVHAGNKGCAVAVGNGDAAFALTDTDDAIIEKDAGKPVDIIYPDSQAGELGTLFLPNSVAIVKGCDKIDAATQLIDFLLSPEVEAMLAKGTSAQIPLNSQTKQRSRLGDLKSVLPMTLSFEKSAAAFREARTYIEGRFLR